MAKYLFTGDWQLQSDSLHTIKEVGYWLLEYCLDNKITSLINLGDMKQVFSPVDVRVYNVAIKLIRIFTKENIKFYLLKGNHDKIGQGDDTGDWFPALRAAGAVTITKPKIIIFHLSLLCASAKMDKKADLWSMLEEQATYAGRPRYGKRAVPTSE